MIARLTGRVLSAEADCVVLGVGGVGYLVSVPAPSAFALAQADGEVTLHTALVLRGHPDFEAALYGFEQPVQQKAFRLLIGVNGVGPRVALAILSGMDVAALGRAIAGGDSATLTRVPGIGPRTASRICLELAEKMAEIALEAGAEPVPAGAAASLRDDVAEALVALGYNRAEARRAADQAIAAAGTETDAARVVAAALKLLGGQ